MSNFDFGKNWAAFSARSLSESSLTVATESLTTMLERNTLEGFSFFDIGSGSGLFSIAAAKLGAKQVVGIDYDPICIDVALQNAARFSLSNKITFLQMSILEEGKVVGLGKFDIVYAWGSLHHTGNMWRAIEVAANAVGPEGSLIVAIYNRHFTSPIWKIIKRIYNHLPRLGQLMVATLFSVVIFFAKLLVTRKNPLRKERGMSFWHDIIDWVGGYPYEYANCDEVERFVSKFGFVVTKMRRAEVPTGCNEFIFTKLNKPAAK